jgi:hypothetical protein
VKALFVLLAACSSSVAPTANCYPARTTPNDYCQLPCNNEPIETGSACQASYATDRGTLTYACVGTAVSQTEKGLQRGCCVSVSTMGDQMYDWYWAACGD